MRVLLCVCFAHMVFGGVGDIWFGARGEKMGGVVRTREIGCHEKSRVGAICPWGSHKRARGLGHMGQQSGIRVTGARNMFSQPRIHAHLNLEHLGGLNENSFRSHAHSRNSSPNRSSELYTHTVLPLGTHTKETGLLHINAHAPQVSRPACVVGKKCCTTMRLDREREVEETPKSKRHG